MVFGMVGLLISGFINKTWSHYFCLLVFLSGILGVSGYVEGWFYCRVSFNLMIDLLSWSLIYLSLWIGALMFLASVMVFNYNKFPREFIMIILLLIFSLVLVFLVDNMLSFYIFFEASLVPTLFLISGWGYQPERLRAGLYLFFYTMFGSLPLLLGILFIKGELSTMSFSLLNLSGSFSLYLFFIMTLAFLVKMPMFLVHLWLPKAHVEAPISGSMVLAGILLKLGGYGLLRVLILFTLNVMFFGKVLIVLSLFGGMLISLLCLRQFDLKSLIAYSSVVHMGLALGGIMVVSSWGLQGVMTLMIGHGLCSSGLFAGANMLYERSGTRSMLMTKGLLMVFPSFVLWWFLLCVSNMASPPSLNLLGEISLMISLISYSGSMGLLLAGVSFFSAAYSLYLFSLVGHGSMFSFFSYSEVKIREYMLLIMHWIPLNFFILKGDLVFMWL
uniref:NADH-ubiquinone oxidoreductase chain 4 n=1 Tax=Bothropolys sp. SP-2004 TaxID=292347 RepID=A5D6J8_9MYRI|nr:NADH dehydrogenase subunit 4 [Bothropolys sp. SP-2004]